MQVYCCLLIAHKVSNHTVDPGPGELLTIDPVHPLVNEPWEIKGLQDLHICNAEETALFRNICPEIHRL